MSSTPRASRARRPVLVALFAGLAALVVAGERPALADARMDAARQEAAAGRHEAALAAYDAIAAEGGAAADEAQFQKALVLFSRLRRFPESLAAFEDLPRRFPDSARADDAYYYAGFVAQFHLKDPDRAVEIYRAGYGAYPRGDYRWALADKVRELTGMSPAELDRAPLPATASSSPEGITFQGGRASARPAPATDVADTAPMRPRSAREVLMQFDKAPIRTFVQWVASVTGRNFIVDDEVTGEITVFSGRAVPLAEVYRVFLSILEVKGFAAVDAGDVVKVVARGTAAQSELPIVIDEDGFVPTDRVVTRIFRLRSTAAAAAQSLLRPFLATTDQLVASPEANTLIATGPGINIARIAELVALLETQRTPMSVRSYRIQYARAAAIADKIGVLAGALAPPGATAPTIKVLADERTNMLHVLAEESMQLEVRRLVAEFDVDRTSDRLVRVFPLGYARSEEVVKQLRSLLGLDAVDNAPDFGGVTQTVILADVRLNAVSVAAYTPRVLDLVDSYIRTIDRPPADAFRRMHVLRLQNAQATSLAEMLNKIYGNGAVPATAGATAGASNPTGLADEVVITADQRTNSLIVTCADVDWEKLEQLIRDLDVRKRQVLIDAVVLETNLDEARSLGATIGTADQPLEGHTRVAARSDPIGFLPTYQALVAQGGLTVGVVRGQLVAGMLNALLSSSRTNVLQMPQILALDNEVATLKVGNLTPIVTSRSIGASNIQIGGSSSVFQNVEYRNIGLNVTLKPSIGESGDILIESRIEIQNRNLQAEAGLDLPVFTSREIEQKFQINDGEYIVLGGLLRTQDDATQRETPWLSRVPLLGALFKSSRASESKTVLLIFLRPRVVNDLETARTVTEEERLQYEAEARRNRSTTEAERWIRP